MRKEGGILYHTQTQPSKTQIKYSLAHVWKMEETTTVGSGVDFEGVRILR